MGAKNDPIPPPSRGRPRGPDPVRRHLGAAVNSTKHTTLHINTLRRVALAATAQAAGFYRDHRRADGSRDRRLAQVARAAAVVKFDQIINGETR